MLGFDGDASELAARLGGLLDAAMDAIVTLDDTLHIVQFNRAAERTFGYARTTILGARLERLMPERFRAGHAAHIQRFGKTGTTSRGMGVGTVLYGLRASGDEFPMEVSISQVVTGQGRLYTAIVRDVTDRVRAQEDLTAFAAQAHQIREEEKKSVARELHDELAQQLTALKMDVGWVRAHLGYDTGALDAKLTAMQATLDTTVAATRRIAAELRPLMLDDLGLVAAVDWLVQRFMQRTGVHCTLLAGEEVDLAEPFATAVFRMVQEALANVAKHAWAKHVEVRIDHLGNAVALRVADDGCGFDASAPRKLSSLGLMGLRERTHLVRGTINIESKPGHGTVIEVRIPLHAAAGG